MALAFHSRRRGFPPELRPKCLPQPSLTGRTRPAKAPAQILRLQASFSGQNTHRKRLIMAAIVPPGGSSSALAMLNVRGLNGYNDRFLDRQISLAPMGLVFWCDVSLCGVLLFNF